MQHTNRIKLVINANLPTKRSSETELTLADSVYGTTVIYGLFRILRKMENEHDKFMKYFGFMA